MMREYELTHEAAEDLQKVFDYTIDRWGMRQAQSYKDKLLSHFVEIGRGEVHSRKFLTNVPDVQISRCENHYVFHLDRGKQVPLIIAVFHQKMDLLTRIKGRLEP